MKKLILCPLLFTSLSLFASEENSQNVYTLGRIEVVDLNDSGAIEQGTSSVLNNSFEQNNLRNVSQAAAILPGVNMANSGARNEKTVYVRGFDLRQVPLLLDGIPVYVPYDGYVDLGRFITNDISEVQVFKGYSSALAGPNAMGGVINIVSQRPTKYFQSYAKLGTTFDNKQYNNGTNLNLSVGGRRDKFYYMISGQTTKHEYIRPSNDYQGDKPTPHSRTYDQKLNLKFAYTPNKDAEYSINYINQHGDKDVPTYVGTLSTVQKRYWTYPTWDKRSLYWISQNQFSNSTYFKTRAYYDIFKNTVNSYDDATYSTMNKSYAFTSYYDDDSYGGNLELGHKFERMTLKSTFHGKRDNHRENNQGAPVQHFYDNTFSTGIENTFHFSIPVDLITGASFDWRESIRAENYNSTSHIISNYAANTNTAFNPQAKIVYHFNDSLIFHAIISEKSRFPTMKDRYSYRSGKAIPNPNLSPEKSIGHELGSQLFIQDTTTLKGNLFYYDIRNTLQAINVTASTTQMQNIGRSSTKGAEFEFTHTLNLLWEVSGNYTYLAKKNLTSQNIYFTDIPKHHAILSLAYETVNSFRINPSLEYSSMRYSDSTGTQTVAGFYTANLVGEYRMRKEISFDFGIKNIFDRYYELASGYPEEGRNYFINARITF